LAGDTKSARLGRGPLRRSQWRAAVECHGKDSGDRRLSDPAMAAENVPVSDSPLAERIEQRSRDVFLSGHVGEALGTVFAGENLISHGKGQRRVESSASTRRREVVSKLNLDCRPRSSGEGSHRRMAVALVSKRLPLRDHWRNSAAPRGKKVRSGV
jgi:hypothetical protein